MSIAEQITRLQGIKADIRTALLAGGIASATHDMADFPLDIINYSGPIQVIDNGDFSNGTTGWEKANCTISADSNGLHATVSSSNYNVRVERTISAPAGHKVLLVVTFTTPKNGSFMLTTDSSDSDSFLTTANTLTTHYSLLTIGASDATKVRVYLNRGLELAVDDVVDIKYAYMIDLGSGNEPDLATCQRLFKEDYYPYNVPSA